MKLVGDLDTEKDSYNVGDVIYHCSQLFIVARVENKYTAISLSDGLAGACYDSLQQLRSYLDADDVHVTGEHVVVEC